ncbi:MAG: threonine/serine exporter family protein [Firmicutes bacterium]|nr:threonine/serine exporter family protein [Bacillota bacterium]
MELERLTRLTLEVGRTLMSAGAETYRAEQTMEHVARALGGQQIEIFAVPTGVFLSVRVGEDVQTGLAQVRARETDLRKIALINNLSRALESGQITAEELEQRLQGLAHLPQIRWRRRLGTAIGCAASALLLGGTLVDSAMAMLLGWAVFEISEALIRLEVGGWFLSYAFGSFAGGGLAVTVAHLPGTSLQGLLVASVLPLVPGVALTNGVRDLIGAHLLSGSARAIEAATIGAILAAGATTGVAVAGSLWP